MKRALVLALVLGASLTACGGSSHKTAAAGCTPTGKGTTDLSTKPVPAYRTGAEPTVTTSYDEVCGTGAQAVEGSNVTVKYVGVLFKDGTEFDSSWKTSPTETLPFQIGGGVIAGFSKGTLGMKVGGRREVVIPAADGYGAAGQGPIPGGATLIFIIDLVSVS